MVVAVIREDKERDDFKDNPLLLLQLLVTKWSRIAALTAAVAVLTSEIAGFETELDSVEASLTVGELKKKFC